MHQAIQTSGFLTTAYDEGDGSVYVYYFDNFTPGKLRMIKDRPGLTEPDPETLDTEEYEQSGMDKTCDVASTLFTPYGDQAQYAICSPIVTLEAALRAASLVELRMISLARSASILSLVCAIF